MGAHQVPTGRGFFAWVLGKCEGGDLSRLIARCQECHVTFLAIKAANGGSPWRQFNDPLVTRLHAAGIRVFGWGYDYPDRAEKQADAVKRVAGCGADGYIIDAEVEWERPRCKDPDRAAREYVEAIAKVVPEGFVLGDAPWDVIPSHLSFPFTEFGRRVAFRAPQAYWIAHRISVENTCERYARTWDRYEENHVKRPHLPAGSLYDERDRKGRLVRSVTADEVRAFEAFAQARGCLGVIHWEWSQVPTRIWDALARDIPPY